MEKETDDTKIHNPYSIQVGDIVTDGESDVLLKVIDMTPGKMFSKVQDLSDNRFCVVRSVMTYRLIKKES